MTDFSNNDGTGGPDSGGGPIWLVSPYHGGSHEAWANGLRECSTFSFEALTLPARFWKWRMHGGAVTLARKAAKLTRGPALILATDMLDLTSFLSLTRGKSGLVPSLLYMHENQLTYPLPANGDTGPMRRQRGERDLHYAFVNYVSMLAADRVIFNSTYHRESLFAALENFLKRFPEYTERQTVELIRERSSVLPIGIDWKRLQRAKTTVSREVAGEPALILWNQRWEYDKNPQAFFAALRALAAEGYEFQVAVCGQNFRRQPVEFSAAAEHLGNRLIHFGYAEPARYQELLWRADITISTAVHEFFGISILEAIACNTLPILPRRLSYPELIPKSAHQRCLYRSQQGLLSRLRWALDHRFAARQVAQQLAIAVRNYAWEIVAPKYDAVFEALAGNTLEQPRGKGRS